MKPRSLLRDLSLVVGLALVYLVVMAVSGSLLAPSDLELSELSAQTEATSPSAEPSTPRPTQNLMAGLAIALIDTLLFCWLARSAPWTGWRLWLCIAAVFFGVKTFTSQLEAWFFMPNVDGSLAFRLALMWIPLAVLWSAGVAWAFGAPTRSAEGGSAGEGAASGATGLEDVAGLAQARLRRGRALVARVAILSAVVYPMLFFGFGYFVAWQSEAVQGFYLTAAGGGEEGASMPSPGKLYLFETMRGALWVVMAIPMLLARGSWLQRGLLIGLVFALVQNNVHWLSNPLMPGEVRFWHFWETSSSNLVWGLLIAFLLCLPSPRS